MLKVFDFAILEAWKTQCQTFPNPSVGAVVFDKHSAILSVASHKEAGKPHAEVLALQEAYAKLSGDFAILELKDSHKIHSYLLKNAKNLFCDCTIFTSLEPCSHEGKTPSCAKLLCALRLKCVIVGARDSHKIASGGIELLKQAKIEVKDCEKIESYRVIHQKCLDLLLPFLLLQKGSFVLFKYASRLNGGIDGGQITQRSAQSFMHNLRSKADFLLISGKTLREDNPHLDARFCTLDSKRAPNVLALSKSMQKIPKDLNALKIQNRSIEITQEIPKNRGFVLVEGGKEMLESMLNKADMFLVFLHASLSAKATYSMDLDANFKVLHTEQMGDDILLWLVRKS